MHFCWAVVNNILELSSPPIFIIMYQRYWSSSHILHQVQKVNDHMLSTNVHNIPELRQDIIDEFYNDYTLL